MGIFVTRRDLRRLAEELVDVLIQRGLCLATTGSSSRIQERDTSCRDDQTSDRTTDEPPTYIYALLDPGTESIRYIGKSDDPETRLFQHVYECKCVDRLPLYDSAKQEWIRELLRAGAQPEMRILEMVPRRQHHAAERRWIRWAIERGHDLTNTRDCP